MSSSSTASVSSSASTIQDSHRSPSLLDILSSPMHCSLGVPHFDQPNYLATIQYTLSVSVTATPDGPRNKASPRPKPSDPHASDRFQSPSIAYQTLPVPALRAQSTTNSASGKALQRAYSSTRKKYSFGEAALQEAGDEAEREEGREEGEGREMRYGAVITKEDKAKKEERNRKYREISPRNPTALDYYKTSTSTTSPKRTHSSQPTNPPSVSIAGYIAYKANTMFLVKRCRNSGSLSPAERQKLEEQPAEKGLQALFKGAKLAVDSVLREVCDRVLEVEEDTNGIEGKGCVEAVALQILGDAYVRVRTRKEKGGIGIGASSTSHKILGRYSQDLWYPRCEFI
ncbi:hypothetical protein EV359DRAFT_86525 [Lentinula novae-zelandiae]|nr:hypothetical protein EV359DRAFT_86525 [Lentinula novae-zelandiae]